MNPRFVETKNVLFSHEAPSASGGAKELGETAVMLFVSESGSTDKRSIGGFERAFDEAEAGELRLQRHRRNWVLHVTVDYPVAEPGTNMSDSSHL